jgi:hypothetical protein
MGRGPSDSATRTLRFEISILKACEMKNCSWSELVEMITTAAKACHASNITSDHIYKQADEQQKAGWTVSAPYTRLLASAVKELEDGN